MTEATPEPAVPEVPPSVVRAWLLAAGRPYVGWVVIGIGVIALALGWYGVSGESVVAKQIPYLASGGLAGLACIVLGSRLLLIEDLRRDSGRLDRLETMVTELHAVLLTRAGATVPEQPAATATMVSVVPGGTTFHRSDCVMLEGRADEPARMRVSTATKRGLPPCPLCEPVPVTV